MESTGFTVNTGADDFDSEPSPSPMVMESEQSAPTGSAEVISLDNMRNAMIANFEKEDLDVPAFLRRRGEVI